MRTAPRRAAAVLGAALSLAATATACGIRATSVPVDAGPAPARVSCTLPGATASASAAGETVRLYLVCRGAQVTAVSRTVAVAPGATASSDRLDTARRLLAELQSKPGADESAAGLSTSVPGSLDLGEARRTDPAGTLRLGVPLDELPPFALAQIVCTLAGTAAGSTGNTVVLGGTGSAAPRRFSCTEDLRTLPDTAQTAGTAVK
ncbi:hypothetical protein OG607_16955 [Streptomyces sp. NBC_01537]|uniref:hypothetical protein n=1 Tax=Streptomyces sp. NBC_01537 TaxID=2903896 RepID=UPI00386CBB4B